MKLFPWGWGHRFIFLGIGEGVNLTGVLLTHLWCLFQTWPCRTSIYSFEPKWVFKNVGRFQKISIPIARTAFQISEGDREFTIMEF